MINLRKTLKIIAIIANTAILFLFLKEKKYFYLGIVIYNYLVFMGVFNISKNKKWFLY